ncbi:hypothetical protein ABIE53_004368 [Burkholderia sp. OAS925]
MPSNETTVTPAPHACLMTPLSAVGDTESTAIALKPWSIRFWICWTCSVAWLSAVVKLGAAATIFCLTAGSAMLDQLLSIC